MWSAEAQTTTPAELAAWQAAARKLAPTAGLPYGYFAWALASLFLRSSGEFNIDPVCRTGVLVRRLRSAWRFRLAGRPLQEARSRPNVRVNRQSSVWSFQERKARTRHVEVEGVESVENVEAMEILG
jgi:hypothetical protein